ncbi:leucine--tRNA ligase [Candidatus Uhrbacteria bacterium]|nr:leucine--tRNA ligase [Candidatus Uhrbacteria bacterium]
MAYNHQEIEKKWQQRWEAAGIFHAKDFGEKKFYCLIEFPYPSGAGLHIGHPRSYTALDVVARKRRHQGMNVLYPIGWDAFGLPTENYAIKTGRKPQDVTLENVATFKRQLQSLGLSFDWSREVDTTDPAYYQWTQWMFLQFFKAGLAYKAKQAINWCLSCKIGLANEEVVNGKCERCGGDTEKREKEQWMIAITKYADRLLDDLDTVDYLEKIKASQRHWIGKSEGVEIGFLLRVPGQEASKHSVQVFTTRADTIFGATFLVISPEIAKKWIDVGWAAPEPVREYVDVSLARAEMDRTAEGREKTGVDTGVLAINPANGKEIPVWVADYVLGSYGTGAIMAVPQHDERDRAFAQKFGLPIVDEPLVPIDEVILKVGGKKTVKYKLRDWVFSRQRYWGEPIPLVWCEVHGWVAVPDESLPVVLPEIEKYEPTDSGESPLASIESFVNTVCPTCGAPAKRETDTMPNWAGSSWYFLRYIDAHNDAVFAAPDKLKYWMPVDLYNGGNEHTTLHLLYSRFWNKFLFDQGHVPTSEPYARRHSHGLVLASDGTKMSKSKGNVVNPDEIVSEYGADALRMYILFMGPFEEPVPWSLNGLIGVRRFLDKVVKYVTQWREPSVDPGFSLGKIVEPHLKKISDDIEAFKFNTAVAAFMTLMNDVGDQSLTREQLKRVLIVLCPFAPHVANECWEVIGEKGLVEQQPWPTFDEALLVRDSVEMAVQVNGKARSTITIAPDADEATARAAAFLNENVAKHLEGKEIVKVIYVPGRILNVVTK